MTLRSLVRCIIPILAVTWLNSVPTVEAADLEVLARPGIWPAADHLIAYRGDIWFSSAVKGVNHNSADIWSYDPAARQTRFRRYLFSQDTGRPAVHKGLLYWPHEDMRTGMGLGTLSVTNGSDWRNLQFSVGDYMMHTHAATEWRGQLVTALAGWRSALAASSNGGATWRTLINKPADTGRFHRYNDLVAVSDRLFVRHWQTTGVTLAEYRGAAMTPVAGWPADKDLVDLTAFQGALYGLVEDAAGNRELWRFSPERKDQPTRVTIGVTALDLRVMVTDGLSLSVVTRTKAGGQVWTSGDGIHFSKTDTFSGGRPLSAAALAPGLLFIGGAGADGRAILWGPASDRVPLTTGEPPALPTLPKATMPSLAPPALDDARQRLTAALAEPASYERRGRLLQTLINAITAQNPPADFFAAFLDAPVPETQIPTFGGRYHAEAREIATWRLMIAMARHGEAAVPVHYLTRPWRRKSNGPQKWFDPLLIALHTVALAGQNDRPTIDALIGRLDTDDDPDWLRSQVTGTLSAVTGQRFAYDAAAWKRWWAQK